MNFLPDDKLFVFATLRCVRDFIKNSKSPLSQKAISIGDFLQKTIFVRNLQKPTDAQLLLIMQQACKNTQNAHEKLAIPKDFFAFLKHNDYLFSFFKEIAHQRKDIDDLKMSDIYANYEEHIQILSNTLTNYKELMLQNGFYDDISICDIYEINEDFISQYSEINIQIDGILSEFEWEIILKCKELTKINIIFDTSKLNKKLIEKIATISKKSIDEFLMYHKLMLNLNTLELSDIGKNQQNRVVLTKSFQSRSLQAAFVFEKISTFIKDGMSADKIAVILPDEGFAQILKMYDDKKFLSFAMGKPFSTTLFYTTIKTIFESLKEQKSINLNDDVLNEKELKKSETFLNLIHLDKGLFDFISINYSQIISFDDIKNTLEKLCEYFGDRDIYDILNEELFLIHQLINQNKLRFFEVIELLLIRLNNAKIDEVGGGAVRVFGILESRGLKFDGVIIVDFNDDLVPKRSINEMFLSSNVRKKAGLVSYKDRENLQRSYYESLICNAKKVAISYVTTESKIASRFLNEFACIPDTDFDEDEYIALFRSGKKAKFQGCDTDIKHDFFEKPLSFTRLNTFRKCPRKYYYHYVLKLGEPRSFDQGVSSDYGNSIHKALFEYYKNYSDFNLSDFLKVLEKEKLNPLEFELASMKFKEFEKSENEHFLQDWKVSELECEKTNTINGINIKGTIDRIDIKGSDICVIDYKTGSSKDPLQLEFYELLIGKKCETYFYNLKDDMKLEACEGKDEIVKILDEIKEYFSNKPTYKPTPSTDCSYCPFFDICERKI
ncbi:PD-(D/E)XK nuclease family protein [Campylobacter pinnipediorum]|uniref:PD-(D/E)XK nuclease family protein n=1 Tax=Campylobacter pinnipediorum TaxID=1965231 RepID=UPI0009AEB25B|nr:PD-(D/E)XK nuclease family protein [Campylobacter pinnipediorum]